MNSNIKKEVLKLARELVSVENVVRLIELVLDHQDYEMGEKLLDIARSGRHDGDHHKAWVIQEMVKEFMGWSENQLQKWIDDLDWEKGIPP